MIFHHPWPIPIIETVVARLFQWPGLVNWDEGMECQTLFGVSIGCRGWKINERMGQCKEEIEM